MEGAGQGDRGASSSERIYRALTRAYPEEVRRRYANEMVGYFGDLCREARLVHDQATFSVMDRCS